VASRLYRRPALTHTLWLLVLLKLVTPPIVRIPVSWQPSWQPVAWSGSHVVQSSLGESMLSESAKDEECMEDVIESELVSSQSDDSAAGIGSGIGISSMVPVAVKRVSSSALASFQWDWLSWSRAIVWVWFAGSVAWFVTALGRMLRFHRLLRHGKPASGTLAEQGVRIARRLELGRCPEVWVVPGRVSPLLWAVGGRARLVLPRELLESLEPAQQATLLAHELAHALRRDHWVRWLEFLVIGIYWWHPVVWWARQSLQQAEEQCCDAWVVWALPGRARAYAEALLETVGFLSGVRSAVPPAASGIGHVQLLRRRLTMILRETLCPRVSWRARLAAIVLGVAVLPIAPYHWTAAADPGIHFDYGPSAQQEREIRNIERRLDLLEQKLDRVISSFEAARETTKVEKPARAADETGQSQKKEKEIVKRAKAEAARFAQEAKQAVEQAKRAKNIDPEELNAIGRQVAESIKENFDPARMAELGRQIGQTVNTGLDPEQLAEIGRQIGEIASKNFDPKQMEELGKKIEQAVNENLNPERMKELERQIEDAVSKTFDPEKMAEFERAIEEAIEKGLDSQQLKDLGKQIERSIKKNVELEVVVDEDGMKAKPRIKAGSKPQRTKISGQTGSEAGASNRTPEAETRQFERRMKALEDKMDRLLEALESNAAKPRQ
jgi:beta-lactamase regulating signal transducer with metallopeptidase domain/general stress protein YciG